jgi:hypothetical protein
MLLPLAVALLATTPAPGHLSLLASDAPALPAAARVLTQSAPEAAPPLASPELEARIQDTLQRIRALNKRIDAVDTGWPESAIFMTTAGVILCGVTVIALPLALISAGLGLTNDTYVLPFIALGVTGGVLLVLGYTTANSALEPAEREVEQLTQERDALRRELQQLKEQRTRQQGLESRPLVQVTLLSLAF